MRSFVRATLEDGEFAEVTEAANGFEALRLLPRERYDLVVTDINMPDIHGLELLSFMRKSEVHAVTPVIIVSTENAQRDRERGMALGANAYLTKPFDPEALRADGAPRGRGGAEARGRERAAPGARTSKARAVRRAHNSTLGWRKREWPVLTTRVA